VLEISSEEAELDGWTGMQTMFMGESWVIRPDTPDDPQNTSGETATFEIDVPCADTWHVWVRVYDAQNRDSLFVQVDGEPQPPPIFEAECTDAGDGFVWAQLNQRLEGAAACEHAIDPWTFDWDAGSHDLVFMPRETPALGRLVVTNDPDYAP
jgi:hypothetical protein